MANLIISPAPARPSPQTRTGRKIRLTIATKRKETKRHLHMNGAQCGGFPPECQASWSGREETVQPRSHHSMLPEGTTQPPFFCRAVCVYSEAFLLSLERKKERFLLWCTTAGRRLCACGCGDGRQLASQTMLCSPLS